MFKVFFAVLCANLATVLILLCAMDWNQRIDETNQALVANGQPVN